MTLPKQTVGGFFGLELPTTCNGLPPNSAAVFQTGRSCLRAILEIERPRRLWLPYYICDAVLAPAHALGIDVTFYPIDEKLSPSITDIPMTDALVVVDYFGLCGCAVAEFEGLGARLIVDQTQALFALGPPDVWRFTSARKWFGVPDGGFLWGPRRPPPLTPRAASSLPFHLTERRWGDPAKAYRAFVAAEEAFVPEVLPASDLSVALLRGVDVELVRERRRRNYSLLEERLAPYNTLHLMMSKDVVPFCYPMLPLGVVPRQALASQGIFVPTFWHDCLRRGDTSFRRELDLSWRLLPLPVDHRYEEADMARLADDILKFVR